MNKENNATGFPSPATGYKRKRLMLDDFCITHPESSYFLKAQGTAMQEMGIYEGDVLVVSCLHKAQHGDIVIASIDNEFICRQLQLLPRPALIACGSEPPIYLHDDIHTIIFGVVTHCLHRFK